LKNIYEIRRFQTATLQTKRVNGASWKAEYSRLADEIHVRHYSSKTLKTYRGWVQKFQTFTRSKTPELLLSNDVKEFLTFLAVKRKVASTITAGTGTENEFR